MQRRRVWAAAAALLVTVPAAAPAFDGGRRGGPPPEAVAACAEKQEGDAVTFTGRRGETVSAVCREREGGLVAVPEGGERGRRGGGRKGE